MYVIKLHTNNTHTKFQSITFIFGCAMAKNQINVMSLFGMHFFVFLIVL